MGQLGQRLYKPSPVLRRELQRAYADEWFAHYNFWHVAELVGGRDNPAVGRLLHQKSRAALRRAEALNRRLLELGTEPVEKLTDLPRFATDKSFPLPADHTDIAALLRAVLDAERTSVKTYRRLYERSQSRDPLTAHLCLTLLEQAVRSEDRLERITDVS